MDQSIKNSNQSDAVLFHQVFDKLPEGFQVIDGNWKYVYVNEVVAKQGRSTVDELVGHTMMEKYPGIEKTPLFTELKRCIDEKIGIRMENEFVFPNGQKGWFQLFIHPWNGGVMIFSIDITQRKFSEQSILKTIENFRGAALYEGDRKNMDELKKMVENLSKPSVTVMWHNEAG